MAGILEIADDAIISIDQGQCVTMYNQGAEKIFGYTAHEIIGQPIGILIPERSVALHQQHIVEFAHSGDTARRMGDRRDIHGRRKDGTEFPAEASISKLEIEGEYTFTIILRDITSRVRFEQALHDKNIELERASQAKDRFLASMSHELRTPLNAVIGFTGTLLMRLPGPLTADQERQLRTIQGSARHLLSLINDLLDVAKIESGRIELSREPVSCHDVFQEVTMALQPLAEQKGIQIVVQYPDTDVILQTDRRAIHQILINLVNNAIKFTEQGEVRLSVTPPGSREPQYTTISVSDTGTGIPTEDQARLFDAFAQGSARPGRLQEGTGLGLYLSQKLADLLGGTIEFTSIVGQGSTFHVTIPHPA